MLVAISVFAALATATQASNTSTAAPFATWVHPLDSFEEAQVGSDLHIYIGDGELQLTGCAAPLNSWGGEVQTFLLNHNCSSVPKPRTVTASGTLLMGTAETVICCAAQQLVSVISTSSPGGIVVGPTLESFDTGEHLSVGALTQIHRLDTQLLVSSFMQTWSPFLVLLPGAVASVVYWAVGRTGKDPQRTLDACRFGFGVALLTDVVVYVLTFTQGQWSLATLDTVTMLSKAIEMATGITAICAKNIMRIFSGDSASQCAMKGGLTSAVSFASSGSVASIVPLLQSVINGWQRLGGDLPHASNVRRP